VLADAGLVARKASSAATSGTVWAFHPGRLDDARQALDTLSRAWDATVERLRAHVEEG
jgi:hypothetical protein